MKITMLGTGNALATHCYNTCFLISDNESTHFLVDAGGGNTILSRLEKALVKLSDIHTLFVTHTHIDHFLGVIWLVRAVAQSIDKDAYTGDFTVYGHDEVISLLHLMCNSLLIKKQTRYIGQRIHFVEVKDGDTKLINSHEVTFFDIKSTKTKQFGFTFLYDKSLKLTCCGDEPYNSLCKKYVEGSTWLMHEAFCLEEQADIFKPHEKHHSTVADSCKLAKDLGVKNLILYHTEDKNLEKRKELYLAEGKKYFDNNIYVPDDLEEIQI